MTRLTDKGLQLEIPVKRGAKELACSISSPDRIFVSDWDKIFTYRRDPGGKWIDEGPIAGFHGEAEYFVETEKDCLWTAIGFKGFAKITRDSGSGQTWQDAKVEVFGEEHGLPKKPGEVRVAPAPGGPFFITSAGVLSFDAASRTFRPAPSFAAAPKPFAGPIASIREEEIWANISDAALSSDAHKPSIGCLRRGADGRWTWHPLPQRIVNVIGNAGASELFPEPGVLWIFGMNAIIRVDTNQLTATTENPQPLVWRRIERSDVGALSLKNATAPVLPYSNQPLRAEFAGVGFAAARSPEYSWRLRGYNDAWSGWRKEPSVELTGLPAGNFTLEVRSTEDAGNNAALAFPFRISPPWVASAPMIAVYGFAVVGAGAGLFRWRVAALRRNQARLEKLVEARTHELREATHRAEMASNAKTMFLASVSHELRTPLHAILGYSQLLENDTTLAQTTRDRVRVVGASGRHLLRLINEVLDLSKIEAGKQELRAEVFNLPTLLLEVADAHETRAHSKGLTLRRPETAGLPEMVIGDAPKLRQVLENLLGNAVKFTSRGGVRLSAISTVAGRIRFEVSDTGPGIVREEIPRLFQPFHQAGSLSAERGTGLGLAITQRLVSLMGGKVELKSEVGQGSCFSFELGFPIANAPVAPITKTDLNGRGRRILAVDDVEANRNLFRDLLMPLDLVVEVAATAEEALDLLAKTSPDLMILDLRLPGMSGLELARQLRASGSKMPILAASASTLGHDPGAALEAGCDDFISKPFLAEDLTAKVGRLLGDEKAEAAASRLDSEALHRLHAAAQEGDVLRIHEEIRRVRAAGVTGWQIDKIERLATAFDMDGVVSLTAAAKEEALSEK